MASKAAIPFLVGMMLLTGACNTLLTKYQDLECVRDCDPASPSPPRRFEQPVWQTLQMFMGEMACWLVVAGSTLYKSIRSRRGGRAGYTTIPAPPTTTASLDSEESGGEEEEEDTNIEAPNRTTLQGHRIILLALPACCDIAGTLLMSIGLLFVAASIYQMTRGALVLFVGLFSVLFLGQRLGPAKWAALCIVVMGVAIVGLAGVISAPSGRMPDRPVPGNGEDSGSGLLRGSAGVGAPPATSPAQTLVGILLIAGAQLFTATQFVLEESIMARHALSPLHVVGWEGTFGSLITAAAMALAHLFYGRTSSGRGGYFDLVSGWADVTSHPSILLSSLLVMASIGGFNFFGLSVTKNVSATSRSTIDTCRTLVIWVVSLGLGWEGFKWLQVVGFAALVYGTFLFNGIVRAPGWLRWCLGGRAASEEGENER